MEGDTAGRVEVTFTEGRRVSVSCAGLDEAQAVFLLQKALLAVCGLADAGKVKGLSPARIVPQTSTVSGVMRG